MTNQIDINDRNKEKVIQNKFKNITLFDYQIKTIEKLLDHEKGQMNLNVKDYRLNSLYDELYCTKYTREQRNEIKNTFRRIKNKYQYNLGYNIGVLSNKVGSGKTYIVLGMIMSKDINSFKTLKKYYFDDIYNNTTFDKDVCSTIAGYLVEPDDICLNTSKKAIGNATNLFKTTRQPVEIETMEIYKDRIKNLIIVPHNLYEQWKQEIETNTTLTHHFIKTKRDLVKVEEKVRNKDLVLCNVNKLKDLLTIIENKYEVDRLFIDEADTINLSNFPEINSKFLWLITTTYERILKPKNQGFIQNLFKTEFKSAKRILKMYLDKFTYTFNSDYIDKKVDLKNPKKKYLIVKNNFINKLFYKIKMQPYYKFINSYDYESLYEYMIKTSGYYNVNTFISKIQYLATSFFRVESNLNYDYILSYEDESSLLYVYIINCLFSTYARDIQRIRYSIDSFNSQVNTIRLHKYNCPTCSSELVNSLTRAYYENVNTLELCRLCEQEDCRTMQILIKEYKKITFLMKSKMNKILRYQSELDYIKHQLTINGYCLECLHRHDFIEGCYYSRFKMVFDSINVNLLNFDEILHNHIANLKSDSELLDNYVYYPEEIEPVSNASLKVENLKIKHMMEKLKQDVKDKKRCLLFSDNYNFFKFIEKELKKNKVKARVLKGNSNTINSILRKYKNYEIDLLLMNMKYCGSGLNLQMSDNIYIMNMVDKNTEKQVIGRVNRINKKGNFEINYFFNEDEYDLYNQEKELTEMLVDNEDVEEIIIEEI